MARHPTAETRHTDTPQGHRDAEAFGGLAVAVLLSVFGAVLLHMLV